MAIGIYSRQSTDKQKSIPFQMELGEKFAKSKGWKFKHYSDKGISGGAKIEDRKEFAQMLDDIQDGIITKVWIWEQDRLEREPMTWYVFCDTITEAGAELYEDGKLIDLNDENVFMLKGIKSLMNRGERKKSAKKSKAKLHSMVEKGYSHGLIPYGYTRDEYKKMIIDPDEAEIIRSIFQWSLDGLGYRAIANKLNDMQVPTSYNKMTSKPTYIVDVNRNNALPEQLEVKEKSNTKWVAGTIKNMLYRKTYIGKRTFGEKILDVPPIIDKATFQEVHNQIEQRSKKSGAKTFHKYLLNDLVWCNICGKRYTGREVNNHFYYRCVTRIKKGESCGNSGIQRDVLDKFIWNHFFTQDILLEEIKNNITNGEIGKRKQQLELEIKQLEHNLTSLKTKQDRNYEAHLNGISWDLYNKYDKQIQQETKQCEIKLNRLNEEHHKIEDETKLTTEIEKDLKQIPDYQLTNLAPFKNQNNLKKNNELNNKFGYNEKQQLINKYINRIEILFNNNIYQIKVHFNLNIPSQTYYCDKQYYYITSNHKYYHLIDLQHEKEHLKPSKLKELQKNIALFD